MTSKRDDIERRLDHLEAGGGEDDPGPAETIIRCALVDSEGEIVGVFSEQRTWRDGAGEWHSEKETYELPNDRIDSVEELE